MTHHLQISVGEGIVSGTLYLLLSSASLAILLRVIWFNILSRLCLFEKWPHFKEGVFQKPGHAGALFCTKAATIAIAVVLIVTIACQVLLFFVFSLFFSLLFGLLLFIAMIQWSIIIWLYICQFACLSVCWFVYLCMFLFVFVLFVS